MRRIKKVAVLLGHVGNDHVRREALEHAQRLRCASCDLDLDTLRAEHVGDELSRVWLIVHDETAHSLEPNGD